MSPSRRLAASILVPALFLAGCGGTKAADAGQTPAPTSPPATAGTPRWVKLPDPPISARTDALGLDVAGKVLVLGGSDATFSGGPMRLPELRDGAVLDLATRTWHTIARAPWAPATASSHVVIGDRLLLARNGPGAWASYDVGDNTWRKVPAPPQPLEQPTMAAIGQKVYVLDQYVEESPAPVQVLDLATNTWTALPAGKHEPALDERTLVATDRGLVVMGDDLFPRQAGKKRQPALAESWNGSRWTRFTSRHAAGLEWFWTGSRVISTYWETKREGTRGRSRTFRASAFVPETGTWAQLPWLPPEQGGLLDGSRPSTHGARVLGRGYLYDDSTGSFRPITNPSSWHQQTQVLTGDAIVVVGGAKALDDTAQGRVTRLVLTNEAWMLATS